jgi:hypothetical protein
MAPIESAGVNVSDLGTLLAAISHARTRFGLDEVWWRGQADAGWGLRPSVFRRDGGANFERNTVRRFAQRARSRHANCPQLNDLVSWLFLMQHYRAPTRLLDWTESPLVALFFAAQDAASAADGALWALSPFHLNSLRLGKKAIVSVNDATVAFLVRAIVEDVVSPSTDPVAAIVADEIDIRMLVQLAAFTLHGTNLSLESHHAAGQYLVRFLVPAPVKVGLRQELWHLGIRRSTLFPDLDNLSEELASITYGEPP